MRPADDLHERQKRYYDARAREYDATAWQTSDERGRNEVAEVVAAIAALPPTRTLDVACGTGFLTQHLGGELTLLDASAEMLEIAGARLPRAERVLADALPLPFADQCFERIFSAQFYDHLRPPERAQFLSEARRVTAELVLVEQTRGPEHREGTEERRLQNGDRYEIHTTYFSPESLTAELEGADLLAATRYFLVVRKRWECTPTE